MSGGNVNAFSPASTPDRINSGKTGLSVPLARFLCPKEFARALEAHGIRATAKTIRKRTRLPASHRLHISRAPGFGQVHIPASELARVLGMEGAA